MTVDIKTVEARREASYSTLDDLLVDAMDDFSSAKV